ncbi:MAG: polysaccharide deacetylase family protein [Chitinivibrionia bacterium]|nr:polysaccharide deacetylase family protein [Chitinivibrionia bacterium]
MNFFKFIYEHRGPANSAKRAVQIATRFGVGPGKMGRRFDRFMDLMDEYGCKPTFPITALPMSRNPAFARHLLERGAELAVHAYTHCDMTTLDYRSQSAHIEKALHLFRTLGVPFCGFRAPYLHWNEDTMKVVEDYRFLYSSNQAVLWGVLDLEALAPLQMQGWTKGTAFYNPIDTEENAVLPYVRRGFVEVPVSLPDDEVLLDRMYMRDLDALTSVWNTIFERTYDRGELFTVMLHPERIDFFRRPLEHLLSSARSRKPGVWIATLAEIAGWWKDKQRNRAVFSRSRESINVEIRACAGAAAYLRREGNERRLEPGAIELRTDARPCVGVSPGSARAAMQQLEDRGYVIEVGETAGDFAIHLGMLQSASYGDLWKRLERLESFPGPLVRFDTWPHGNKSALAVTGDIDALTLWDFVQRFRGA